MSEIATIASALILAFVALAGLKQWRRDQNWKQQKDVARQAILSSFKYLNSLNQMRMPARTELEKSIANKSFFDLSAEEIAVVRAIENDTDKKLFSHNPIKAEFAMKMIEASVVLPAFPGKDFEDAQSEGIKIERAVMARPFLLANDSATMISMEEVRRLVESNVLDFDPADDRYLAELKATFEKLHDGLKPYLSASS